MSLIEEIQNETVAAGSDLGMILRKCKVFAARMGSEPLEHWLSCESDGYPRGVQVPDYRVWALDVKGHFLGSFGSALNNASVPRACLPDAARKLYEMYQCRMSIVAVEEALRQKPDGMIQMSTNDLAIALGTHVYQDYNCVQAWAEFSVSHLVELLNTVRNRILDFSLAVWKKYPEAGEIRNGPDSQPEPTAVTQIFNTAVYGGAASLIGTAQDISMVLNVTANDFDSLSAALKKNGLLAGDIAELATALKSDNAPTQREKFGPAVSSWIGRMVQKAAEGGWEVTLTAAGTLLAQAISRYYGF